MERYQDFIGPDPYGHISLMYFCLHLPLCLKSNNEHHRKKFRLSEASLRVLPKHYQNNIMKLIKNGFLEAVLIFQPEKCLLPADCLQLQLSNRATPRSKAVINTCSYQSHKECPSSPYTRCSNGSTKLRKPHTALPNCNLGLASQIVCKLADNIGRIFHSSLQNGSLGSVLDPSLALKRRNWNHKQQLSSRRN